MSKIKQNEQDTSFAPIYSKLDYDKDEKQFNKSIKDANIDWNSFQRLMMHDLCVNTEILNTGCIGDIRLTDVMLALKYPKDGWRILMAVSDELMRISPHYYRMNNLYSNMALFCWWVDLYGMKENVDPEKVKKIYSSLVEKLENMNLKHEFSKIMKYIPYQDVFCGLVVENSNDFFIQKIDFKICRLYQIQDGIYNFKINLSAILPKELGAYPEYVQKAFVEFIDDKTGKKSKWYMPPADKQICIKLNSQWLYPYPILIGLVKDILDLDIYKQLKLQSARTDNYKAILIEVPIDESQVNKPLITPEVLGVFAEMNRESMSDDIGLLHTLGSKGQAVSFKDSNNTRNNVSDAIDEIYNSSGQTKEYFNGSASGTAVTFSAENDSGFIYGLYRQFERWVNRYIKIKKYNKSNFKFFFYLLDVTIFNRDNVSKRYKEAATLGATVIDKWLASLDMTPSRMLGSYFVHKDIFDFKNNFIPLSSSYNSSEVGRPTNASKGEVLDVEGEKTADGDKNNS